MNASLITADYSLNEEGQVLDRWDDDGGSIMESSIQASSIMSEEWKRFAAEVLARWYPPIAKVS